MCLSYETLDLLIVHLTCGFTHSPTSHNEGVMGWARSHARHMILSFSTQVSSTLFIGWSVDGLDFLGLIKVVLT